MHTAKLLARAAVIRAAFAVAASAPLMAWGASPDRYWAYNFVGDGFWNDPNVWSATDGGAGGASAPTGGSKVFLWGSSGYTVTFKNEGPSPLFDTIEIATGPGVSTLYLPDNQLNTGTLNVANGGAGQVIQDRGTLSVTNGLYVGRGGLAQGTYTLNNGTLIVAPSPTQPFRIGSGGGYGQFDQNGGTVSAGDISIGDDAGSSGAYVLSGGQVIGAPSPYRYLEVGNGGSGGVEQSGGSVSDYLVIIGGNSPAGPNGPGQWTQSGGSNTFKGLWVGNRGAGTYSLSGGTIITTGAYGGFGVAVFNGTFQHSGGTVATPTLSLGNDGPIAPNFYYALSGSGVLQAGNEEIYGGTFNQTGGNNSCLGTILLYDLASELGNPSIVSAYDLQAGTLSAGALELDSNCRFSQSGGYLSVGQFFQNGGSVSGAISNHGTYVYSSGPFPAVMTNGGTLNVVGSMIVTGSQIANPAGATITTGATGMLAISGSWTNSGRISGAGTVAASGGFVNNGTVSNFSTLSSASSMTNYGTISGTGTVISGGSFTNYGTILIGLAQPKFIAPGGIQNAGTITAIAPDAPLFDTTINNLATGVVNLHGVLTGTITSAGTISSDLGDLVVPSGAVLTNQPTGILTNAPGTDLFIRSGSFTNNGNFRANVGGVVSVDAAVPILSGRSATLLGGALAMPTLSVQSGGMLQGYGQLNGNLINAGTASFTGPMILQGNLVNNAGAVVKVRNATTIVYGLTTNNGSITASNGTIIFDGGIAAAPLGAAFGASLSSTGLDGAGAVLVDPGGRLISGYIRQSMLSIGSSIGAVGIATMRARAEGGDTSVVNSLQISSTGGWKGILDLADTALIIDYSGATPAADVRQMIIDGRLTSSMATPRRGLGYADNTVAPLTSFGGQPVDATSVLVKYTWLGDANLDGQVDIKDLYAVASHYDTTGGQLWTAGDYNYDGNVDVQDLTLLASNWQAGVGAPLGSPLNGALSALGLPSVIVPEPAGLLLLGAGLTSLLRRRRDLRRHSGAMIGLEKPRRLSRYG